MSLFLPYAVTALARTTAGDGRNVVTGAIVRVYKDDVQQMIYEDADGANPSLEKQTDVNGLRTIFLPVGEYELDINGRRTGFAVGVPAPIRSISSIDDLRLQPGRFDGQQISLTSYYAGGNTGSGILAWRAAATNDDDDVRWFAVTGVVTGRWELIRGQIISDLTIRIPSDYPTLQSAIDDIHGRIIPAQGVIVDLLIEAGHEITDGIAVVRGDYSYFSVSSTDPVVTISASFPSTHSILFARSAAGPALNCLVDCHGQVVANGVYLWKNSRASVGPNCGVINVGGGAGGTANGTGALLVEQCDLDGSGTAGDDGCNFSGNSYRNVWVTKGSRFNGEKGVFDNGGGDWGVFVSRGSVFNAPLCSVSGCANTAVRSNRSIVVAMGARINDNGQAGLFLDGNSLVNMSERAGVVTEVKRNASNGLVVQASRVHFEGADISENGGNGVDIQKASNGNFDLCLINNNGNNGILNNGSYVSAVSSTINGSSAHGCQTTNGGSSNLRLASIDLSGGNGLLAESGSKISAFNSSVTNSATNGARAADGSHIVVSNGSITGSFAGFDLSISRGSQINSNNTTTTNGSGSPDLSDASVSSFNAIIGAQGIIWA